MSLFEPVNPETLVGRTLDNLRYEERAELAGLWVAQEIYTPQTLPLRRIEAVGRSVGDCVRQLASRGLDPLKFEFVQVTPPS